MLLDTKVRVYCFCISSAAILKDPINDDSCNFSLAPIDSLNLKKEDNRVRSSYQGSFARCQVSETRLC